MVETGAKAGPAATSGQIEQTGTVGIATVGIATVSISTTGIGTVSIATTGIATTGRRQGSMILQCIVTQEKGTFIIERLTGATSL
jgi:hypothetical protein